MTGPRPMNQRPQSPQARQGKIYTTLQRNQRLKQRYGSFSSQFNEQEPKRESFSLLKWLFK